MARNIRHLTNTAKAESAFILPPLSTSPPFYEKQKRCHTDALRSHLELKLRTSCREERAQINCATLALPVWRVQWKPINMDTVQGDMK